MKNKKIFLIVLVLASVVLSGCITNGKDNKEKVGSPTGTATDNSKDSKGNKEKTVSPTGTATDNSKDSKGNKENSGNNNGGNSVNNGGNSVSSGNSDNKEKTISSTNITINGSRMLVNGSPFIVKSVGYSPVPIGDDPSVNRKDYFTAKYSGIYDRDLPLLREMGATAIRMGWINTENHTDFLDKAYNNGKDPIYVILNFWISPNADISSQNVRNKLKSDFRNTVAKYKNNPAILMWSVGNELNAQWRYDKSKLNDLFSLLNEMALEAHTEEGDRYHPVTTTLVDADLIDTIKDYDKNTTSLDIWSVQLYRGKSFGNFFEDYKGVSSKPLVVMEFGVDAFDDRNQTEQEDVQAEWDTGLWKEIVKSNATIGGSITSYSDQWWKARYAERSNKFDCPDDDISFQSDCGYAISSQPDGYTNEEWYGIMRIKDNGSSPDIVEPRKAYYAMRELWTNTS